MDDFKTMAGEYNPYYAEPHTDEPQWCFVMRNGLIAEIARLTAELAASQERERRTVDVLERHGFVRCDIPACNCGSWHHRYGLRERMDEIIDALAAANHPLSNDNGNLPRNALAELVAERDTLQERERVLREWIQDYVVEDGCAYGDNCTDEAMRRYRHGRCTACSGRAALGEP